MAIAQSDTYPSQFAQSRGLTLFRWNITEEQVTDSMTGEARTVYNYSEVAIEGKVTKAKVLAVMRAAELETSDGEASDAAKQYKGAKNNLKLFANLTYAELEAYIDKNVVDLASSKLFLKKLSKVMLAILKKQDW